MAARTHKNDGERRGQPPTAATLAVPEFRPLWTVVDAETKLVPTYAVGKRSADNARRLMVDLAQRLVMPTTGHASDDHHYWPGHYQPITQISTDGFPGYPEAVDLAFGPHAKYGQIIKNYRNASMPIIPAK